MVKVKKSKEVKGIVAWIVRKFKSDYHLAKNPPKGKKRVKKVQPEITTSFSNKPPSMEV